VNTYYISVIWLIISSLTGELLLVVHPTRSNQERRCPNALA